MSRIGLQCRSHQNLPRNNKHVQCVFLAFIMKLIFVSYCSSQVLKLSNAPRGLIAIAHGYVTTFCFSDFGFVLRSCSFALRPESLLPSRIFSMLSSVDVCFSLTKLTPSPSAIRVLFGFRNHTWQHETKVIWYILRSSITSHDCLPWLGCFSFRAVRNLCFSC